MEEKIINALDTLNIDETDRLLEQNLNMDIDSETFKRIKKSVYKKTGLKKGHSIIRKIATVVAAAVLLSVLSIATMGVDNVASAIGRLFSFIPGYAIVENNKNVEYIIEKQDITVENTDSILTLKNAIATKETISLSLNLEKKNFNESEMLVEKQKEWEELQKAGQLKKPDILLYANGKEYKTENFSIGGGGKIDSITADFLLAEESINSQTEYKLEYKDYKLSLNFKLKSYDSFDSLDDIGPTCTLNDISITAISKSKDNKLEVELYPINKSKYKINSFTKVYDKGYKGENLNLATSRGVRKYTIPDSSMGVNNKFYFNISPKDKNLVLNIPYLMVESDESRNLLLKIPKEGQKVVLNKKVEFHDCTMIITEVERVSSVGNEAGALRMNFRYENKDQNKIMCSAQFQRINFLGITKSGGYASNLDGNDILKSVDFNLEQGEDKELRIKIENPEYFLLGEYNLEIK